MKIVFPELDNSLAKAATEEFPDITFLPASNLETAAKMLNDNKADSMISGLDYPSRDVLIAYKNNLPLKSDYFSSCFICERGNTHFALADGGVNKLPTKDQLYTIVEDTATTLMLIMASSPKSPCFPIPLMVAAAKTPTSKKSISL